MALNPDTIRQTEIYGMPEAKPETTECPNCLRLLLVENRLKCLQCGQTICPMCVNIQETFSECFCTEDVAGYIIPTDCEVKWLTARLTDAEEGRDAWKKLAESLQADLREAGL